MLDRNKIEEIKELIRAAAINNVIAYAQISFPNENAGFIFANGAVQSTCNIIETLGDKSLTSQNAFLIDSESWNIASKYHSPVICVYHSHTNGSTEMSQSDQVFLKWPNLCYLIVGILDHHPTAAKLYWWQENELQEISIQL